jgi:1,4-alpha-glucan branching enzyme
MNAVETFSLFSDYDVELFKAGKHFKLYEKFGAHPVVHNGVSGVYFSVWAPCAQSVAVIGEFNSWQQNTHQLQVRWDASGIWEGFIPDVPLWATYKYRINSTLGTITEKTDPYGRFSEKPPFTASKVYQDHYQWNDHSWLKNRANHNSLDAPFSVYEVHLSSWKRNVEEDRFLTYREMAVELVNYVKEMEFTHVELMPVMEFPYDPSWGYQIVGYFATTSRFGTPEDFKYLVDQFHQAGIGVILDWVPSHFPEDAHGLGYFDGSCVYEHPDRRKGFHPDWKSLVFNYGRNEVRAFLISNAMFWLQEFHIDGLRVDAVASMIHLDYSRNEGEWEPNIYGGRENLDAISFLKEFNNAVYTMNEGIITIAEDSTSFPMVSRPTYLGGLGFGMKWMMGWMHDTLDYFKKDPIYRKFHHHNITFSLVYAFSENYMLPFSHDEVVHGKYSILNRMPGDLWQKYANVRALYGYMFTHPGAKLLFMGCEFAQFDEWKFAGSLDWHLLDLKGNKGVQKCVKSLNQLYKNYPALYQKQFESEGFEWICSNDGNRSIISYLRKSDDQVLLVVCNFTPVVHHDLKIGVPSYLYLQEIFNSDSEDFGGSGVGNSPHIKTEDSLWDNNPFSALINVPPLATVVFELKEKVFPKIIAKKVIKKSNKKPKKED